MHLKRLPALLAALTLTACEVTLSAPSAVTPTPPFVTATLPATRTPVARAIHTPQITGTPLTSITAPANCKDAAVLLADVTVQDGENIPYGSRFTKTWKFRNTGTCPERRRRIKRPASKILGAIPRASPGDMSRRDEPQSGRDLRC